MGQRFHTATFAGPWLALLMLLLTEFPVVLGQGSTPSRGFQPGGSYSLSEIETINHNNGNMMLNFVLGRLPAGRAGMSSVLTLRYDSKIYDSQLEYYEDSNYPGPPPDSNPTIVQRNLLWSSDQGGWHYGRGYALQLINRRDQFYTMPAYPSQSPIYCWKVKMAFPDGSVHEFLPRGFGTQALNDGYYNFRPDGYQTVWASGNGWPPAYYPDDVPGLTGATHYYSFDGTFARLDFAHDSNSNALDNPWTLTFPDGTKVTSNAAGVQRITDRNGNYVELAEITYNTHPATRLMDQMNREVVLEHLPNGHDLIHNKGFNNADLVYDVVWKTIQVGKTYLTTDGLSGPDPSGYPSGLSTLYVVSEIDLPTQTGGLKYTFGYNAPDYGTVPWGTPSVGLGEINSVITPSGAQAQYTYKLDNQNGPSVNFTWDVLLKNRIKEKVLTYDQQYDGSSTPVSETWDYDTLYATVVNPDGGRVSQIADDQRVYRLEQADGTVVEKLWQGNAPQGFPVIYSNDPALGYNPYDPDRVNNCVKMEFTSIRDASNNLIKTAITEFTYDKNGNVTSVSEYDYVPYANVPRNAQNQPTGKPSGITPVRVTTNTYHRSTPDSSDNSSDTADSYWNYTAPNLRSALASTEISNGSATQARTEFFYDDAGSSGNLTSQKMWDSSKSLLSRPLTLSNSIAVLSSYDAYGNVATSTDARGIVTTLTYGPVGGFSNLYPTQAVTASNYPGLARTTTTVYDFSTGLPTLVTDVDNSVSTSTTYDDFGRATLVKAAVDKPEETRTTTIYSDSELRMIVKSDLNTAGDQKLVTIQHYDQLGRVRLTRQLEDASTQSATDEQTGIKVQTRYRINNPCSAPYTEACLNANSNVLGSYQLVSNPYRATTSGAASSEVSMGWSRSRNDKGGRLIEVQTFGGASLPFPWGPSTVSTGTVLTSYDEQFITVSDQTGKLRRSKSDALGRLIRVDEPNDSNSLGSTANPNQRTDYTYDALGNLRTVAQDTSPQAARTFEYSSLARLVSAFNPESGTTSYQYDENGNLSVKTDNRGVSSHYSYDVHNRLTRRWHNGSASVSATVNNTPALPTDVGASAEASFYYDGQTLPVDAPSFSRGAAIGRLVAETYGGGSNGNYFGYDALGRAKLKIQQLSTINYQLGAIYNAAGAVTSLAYPSGRIVTNTPDTAGRLSSFSGNLGDGNNRTYASGILYSARGAMVKEAFGTNTPVYNKLFYNSRGQLSEIRVSTSYSGPGDTSWNRGAILNQYSLQCSGATCNATDNNGNLRKQEVFIPANDQVSSFTSWYQQYDYDALNRLKRVHEYTGNSQLDWQQEFLYDRWGNRRIDVANTYGTGINNKSLDKEDTTNRLYAPGDLSLADSMRRIRYDAAGNQIKDTYTGYGAATFDAENRIVAVQDNSAGWSYYTYNADGQRVRRKIGNQETWQVYGFDGELLAEYPANGAVASPQKEYGYRNGQLLITAEPDRTNVALASNGAVSTASSTYSSSYPVAAVSDGEHRGLNWGNGGGWNCATADQYPDWVEINFGANKTITELDVYTLQDYLGTAEPTEAMTFTQYGIVNFNVEYWNGSGFVAVPGGNVTGNNKVWRKFMFAPISTTRVRVWVTNSLFHNSRIVEIEAWSETPPPPRLNVALSSSGAAVAASSEYSASYPASSTINGDRRGLNWGNGGGWNDAVPVNTFPDTLTITFNGDKNIDEIDVFTLQDNFTAPVEPTEVMTFTQWGLTGYDVQYWNGSSWVTVPGGSVSGNNKVWRKFTFAAVTTNKIRVMTNASVDGCSRLTEVEAWTASSGAAKVQWLVTDHLGTPRIIVDQTGSLANVKRHDYLPFGEELLAGTGSRTAALGYSGGDSVRQQFTAKERDIETGLDYFGARYYANIQGRFISTDSGPFTIADPQNFNRYSYVQNNPLKFIDPTGRTLTLTGDDADKLLGELEAKNGYQLTRDAKTGRVTIDKGIKRNKHGTSKHLASLVKDIVGDKKIDVNIEVQENIVHGNNRGVKLDVGYDPKEFDFADYRQLNSADSKLGAIAMTHALNESYEMKKLDAAGFGSTIDIDQLSHIRATYFESRVLSDLTGVREQVRVDRSAGNVSHFEYTSVGYDILWKTTTPTETFPTAVNRVVIRNYKNLPKNFKH